MKQPTGNEVFFKDDEIIVSKTDTQGRITYANDVFLRVAGYSEEEVIGKPHSIIRHPDMPRAVFKFLWERIEAGNEIFAYVDNMSKHGDHYWVYAHVTPTFDQNNVIIGYHSNRRTPDRTAVTTIQSIYKALLEEERKHSDPRKGLISSYKLLLDTLTSVGKEYDEFVWSIAA